MAFPPPPGRTLTPASNPPPRRLPRRRPPQVVLRPARSRLRPGSQPATSAGHVRLLPRLLPLRRPPQLLPARTAKLPRLARAESLDRPPRRRPPRLNPNHLRRHRLGPRSTDNIPLHHHLPLRPARRDGPERTQRPPPRPHSEIGRTIPVQCDHRRQIRLPRLHRKFPHAAERHRRHPNARPANRRGLINLALRQSLWPIPLTPYRSPPARQHFQRPRINPLRSRRRPVLPAPLPNPVIPNVNQSV